MMEQVVATDFYKEKPTEWLVIMPDLPTSIEQRHRLAMAHVMEMLPRQKNGFWHLGGSEMFYESMGTDPSKLRGNLLTSSDVSKEEVWKALKADVYAKEGVWDIEKSEIIPFNSFFRGGLRESDLLAPYGSPNATQPPSKAMNRAKVTAVASFGPMHFLENLAIRKDGSMLISVLSHKQLCYISPSMDPSSKPVVLHNFDQNVMGIVETEPDIFYIATCNLLTDHLSFLYLLDIRSFTLESIPKPVQVLQFPERARALNGSACLSPHVILVANSIANLIWHVDLDPTGADCPDINGIKFAAKFEHLYYTTAVQRRFSRVHVDKDTLEAAGELELVAGGMMVDDFLINEEAEVAYVTTHRENTIQLGAWGQQPGDQGKVTYFTSNGGMKRALPDGIMGAGRVRNSEEIYLKQVPRVSAIKFVIATPTRIPETSAQGSAIQTFNSFSKSGVPRPVMVLPTIGVEADVPPRNSPNPIAKLKSKFASPLKSKARAPNDTLSRTTPPLTLSITCAVVGGIRGARLEKYIFKSFEFLQQILGLTGGNVQYYPGATFRQFDSPSGDAAVNNPWFELLGCRIRRGKSVNDLLQSVRHFEDDGNYLLSGPVFPMVWTEQVGHTWTNGATRRYWTVRKDGRIGRTVAGRGAEKHLQSVYKREYDRLHAQERLQRNCIETGTQTFVATGPWIERTRWLETYLGARQDILLGLAEMPNLYRSTEEYMTGEGSQDGEGDAISSWQDEQRIAALMPIIDGMLDRCEETVQHTSRAVLCWLRSTKPQSCYPKPFTLVALPQSKRKYRRIFKRFFALLFRAYPLIDTEQETCDGESSVEEDNDSTADGEDDGDDDAESSEGEDDGDDEDAEDAAYDDEGSGGEDAH
ncbi:hypothetical protein G7Y89_g3828 [Cudoniella acicularis]|uniref:Uncharacterized protein n=1 Tax=Cudoniella acicularis TaxID=354080 RepID=A0A8H4RTL5_9HELO|nr:hypothetical protein G7Y89_g3828 [Cudoniella acicularis]